MYTLLLNQTTFQIIHVIRTSVEIVELIVLVNCRLLCLLLSFAFLCELFRTFLLFAIISIYRIDIF